MSASSTRSHDKEWTLLRQIGFWTAFVLVGSLTGGISGYVAAKSVAGGLDSRLSQLWSRVTVPAPPTTSTTSNTPILPLETARRPVYPAVFVNRPTSALLPIIKKTGLKLTEPVALPADRLQGYGVSLTSDGWIVLPAATLGATPTAEVGVLWRSRVYPVKQLVRDRASELVFMKLDVTGLPVTSFVSPLDVVPGLGVWTEQEPQRFSPESIIATDARATRDPVYSERVNRRFLVSASGALRAGSAVWGNNGGLIGLVVSSDARGVSVLPTTAISSALSHVLAARPIQRSLLGVKVQDLSSLIYDAAQTGIPEQGVLVRQVVSTSTQPFLQEGDVLLRIDRDAFDGTVDIGERLLDYRPGTTVTIQGVRKGSAFQVDVPLQTTTTSDLVK